MSPIDENKRMMRKLLFVVVVMLGFGFLLVPFYNKLCEATGIQGTRTELPAPLNTQVDTSRWVTVEFDANTSGELPWRFEALQQKIRVHPGALTQVFYKVANTASMPQEGQAVPSYGPEGAGQYFKKIECFCFSRQTLAANESRTMPVQFVVDPQLPSGIHTITLSYTFFPAGGKAG